MDKGQSSFTTSTQEEKKSNDESDMDETNQEKQKEDSQNFVVIFDPNSENNDSTEAPNMDDLRLEEEKAYGVTQRLGSEEPTEDELSDKQGDEIATEKENSPKNDNERDETANKPTKPEKENTVLKDSTESADVVVETVKTENVNPEDDIFPSTSGTARHEENDSDATLTNNEEEGSSESEDDNYRMHTFGDDDPRSLGYSYLEVIRNHLHESTEDLAELADDIKDEITTEALLIKDDLVGRLSDLTDRVHERGQEFKQEILQEADELKNDLTALTLQKFQQLRNGLLRRVFGDNSDYLDVLVQEFETRANEQLDRALGRWKIPVVLALAAVLYLFWSQQQPDTPPE